MTHTFFLLTTPLSATTRCQHLLRPVDTRRLPRSMATAKVEPALCADPPSAPHCANGFPRAPVDGTATWGGQEQWGSGEIRETYPHTHIPMATTHTGRPQNRGERQDFNKPHEYPPHRAPCSSREEHHRDNSAEGREGPEARRRPGREAGCM